MVRKCDKGGGGCKTETEHGKGKKRVGRPCKSGGAGNIKKRVETEHGVEKRRYGRPCKGDSGKKKVEKKAPAKKRAVKGAASKTHPGDKDYTTKKGDKDYHEKGHDVKKKRKPYERKVDARLGNVVEQSGSKAKQSPVQRRAKQGVSKPKQYASQLHTASLR